MPELRLASAGAVAAAAPAARLSRPLQHALCVLLVAAAIKAPLGIPLYFNAVLLVLGLFAILAVQALQPIFLWPMALMGLGIVWAAMIAVLPSAGPRLGQVVLIVFATSLLARIEPRLFARYLILLLPISLIVLLIEPLLPEALYRPRKMFGMTWPRAAGVHGEHNYNAMMLGVVGVILAQHRPKVLAFLPFLLALSAVSRGFILALLAWLGASALRRWAGWLVPLGLLVLFTQPLIVLGIVSSGDEPLLTALDRLTSSRFPLWAAYAEMGLSAPLGVGYWEGPAALAVFDPASFAASPGRDAHSIFLQVFGEFGWLGYLVFAAFIGHVALLARRHAPEQLPLLLFVLTGYAFYDGLSDWAFWIAIGYTLACVRAALQAGSTGAARP